MIKSDFNIDLCQAKKTGNKDLSALHQSGVEAGKAMRDLGVAMGRALKARHPFVLQHEMTAIRKHNEHLGQLVSGAQPRHAHTHLQ